MAMSRPFRQLLWGLINYFLNAFLNIWYLKKSSMVFWFDFWRYSNLKFVINITIITTVKHSRLNIIQVFMWCNDKKCHVYIICKSSFKVIHVFTKEIWHTSLFGISLKWNYHCHSHYIKFRQKHCKLIAILSTL